MARPLLNIDYPSVEERISDSTDSWVSDLKSLFDNAKDRFGDVCWESVGGEGTPTRKIWGHKAIIYSRAPKTFKERYFNIRSNLTSSRLLSPALQPRSLSRPSSPSPNYFLHPQSFIASSSQLSLLTTNSEGTIRPGEDVLQLQSEETPELFLTQLEWLYTGEGLGDVVHWIDTESSKALSRPASLSHGDLKERGEKLGQDLTYMWRSKLYADVRIHLDQSISPSGDSDSSDDSVDSLSSTAVFTSHRFILASRSPYFASSLLNHSFLQPQTKSETFDIHLPTPPFTPASLHFCLGYIYAGHLDFSNRTFDLTTAFAIHRAAAYLQLDTLVGEIESRIVHDFAHGLDWDVCRCKKCVVRVQRIWKFARAPDVAAIALEHRAKIYLVRSWNESWGKEVGLCDHSERQILVKAVEETLHPVNVVSSFQGIKGMRTRLEGASRSRNGGKIDWIHNVEGMMDQLEERCSRELLDHFPAVVGGGEFLELVNSTSFNSDILEYVMDKVVEQVGSANGYREAPIVYQTLTSSLATKNDGNPLQPRVSPSSRSMSIINTAKSKVLAHISRRWMQIRDMDGFGGIDSSILKEISDDVPLEDLIGIGSGDMPFPTRAKRLDSTTSIASSSKTSTPASQSRIKSSIPLADRFTSQTQPQPQPHTNGLKRLRLHSSVSTTSSTGSLSRTSRQSLDKSNTSISSTRTMSQQTNGTASSSTSLASQRKPIISRRVGEPSSSRLATTPTQSSTPLSDSHLTNTNDDKRGTTITPTPPSKVVSPRSTTSTKRSNIGYKPSPSSASISSLRKESPNTSSLPTLPPKTSTTVRPRISGVTPRTRLDSQPQPASGSGEVKSRTVKASLHPTSSVKPKPPTTQVTSTSEKSSNTKSWTGPGITLNVGIPCIVSHLLPNGRTRVRFQGSIRYIGHMDGSKGPWIGVEGYGISKLGIKSLKDGCKGGIAYFPVSSSHATLDDGSIKNTLKGKGVDPFSLRNRKISTLNDRTRQIATKGLGREKPEKDKEEVEVIFVRPGEVVFIMTSD
uniref:BTB domain-containing protein n=1 Tax=Kwoniella bestiolae CBS 10118 TaxID=1296100 RepID=A0A1B9G5Y6_9TREE|nr:hypothetical protein I302_04108 [Kwoniella bestiolae CBS 10118]OCF26423.1 hypothetical protein I302_04108 [Kwoniella bestiolae CBS 10118]